MDIKKAPIKSVLLIDDDRDDCALFEAALSEMSSSIQFTSSTVSEEVFVLVDNCVPDLIFLDINIPKVNGFKCLTMLQNSAKHCRIPIVMYSSSINPREVDAAYGYGASLFFRKPTRYADLVESLQSILLMDWDKPELIKTKYFKEGKYHPFAM